MHNIKVTVLTIFFSFYFSVTVCIHHYFVLVLGAQHSVRQSHTLQSDFLIFQARMWHHSYYNVVAYIPYAVLHIPVTVL